LSLNIPKAMLKGTLRAASVDVLHSYPRPVNVRADLLVQARSMPMAGPAGTTPQ
jgi:hypothetical protein